MFSLGMGPTETPGETSLEVSPIFPYKNINKLGFLILGPQGRGRTVLPTRTWKMKQLKFTVNIGGSVIHLSTVSIALELQPLLRNTPKKLTPNFERIDSQL